MCGIIGVIGSSYSASLILEGLKRLEYRGYDSAGIATLDKNTINRQRSAGKISNLEKHLETNPLTGLIGIGHTRWATHGPANEENAHPHSDGQVAVVHNGIIENFQKLKDELSDCNFESTTDSEVIVHLISYYLDRGDNLIDACREMKARLKGSFALAVISLKENDTIIGICQGSPLAVGYGNGEMYLGSDSLALLPMTSKVSYLSDGDFCILKSGSVQFFNSENKNVKREIKELSIDASSVSKGSFDHFMMKEIHEQPQVIRDTLNALIDSSSRRSDLSQLNIDINDLSKITIVGCGSAYYAGLVSKYWFEEYAKIPVEVDIGSEFRYRNPPLPDKGLAIFISQSGETIDTLYPLRLCKEKGQYILSIVNSPESTIARESDSVIKTLAGPEIGVASTKAFTTQMVTLAVLALFIARKRNHLSEKKEQELVSALLELPEKISEILNAQDSINKVASQIKDTQNVLYLGRGHNYPIALEGALKLKEISYIHAEAYASGEMKHGPIALIDSHLPIVFIAPSDTLFSKSLTNIEQVSARGGRVIALTDEAGSEKLNGLHEYLIKLPEAHEFVHPILYSLPVQLLAYYTAVLKGTDIDQPKNLAKSVTVE